MNKNFENIILASTGAKDLCEIEEIQELWSGYGKIIRYRLTGTDRESVVVKHVRLPAEKKGGPRKKDISHQRKVKSYRVEMAWYEKYAHRCDDTCRVPAFLGGRWQGDEFLMVFEDLDAAGFPLRKGLVSWCDVTACISWLAHFHGEFMGQEPDSLWKQGTYWHLDTRPDELKALEREDPALKKAAGKIDQLL